MGRRTWFSRAAGGVACLAVLAGSAATAPFAYMTAGNGDFGVLNLGTGKFTKCGGGGTLVTGLGVGPGGVLYAGANAGHALYTIDPVTGAQTFVANSNIAFNDVGSTPKGGLYALDSGLNLYALDPTTAVATMIGSTGLPPPQTELGISSGAGVLYISRDKDLYSVNVRTAQVTKMGSGTAPFGALVSARSTLYGAGVKPDNVTSAIFTIDPATAADTHVANIKGTTGFVYGLAPAPKSTHGRCQL